MNTINRIFYTLFIFQLLSSSVQSVRVNITNFSNCDRSKENADLSHIVLIRDITYDYDSDGLCDTVHGKYTIPTVNVADKLLDIMMYRCARGSVGVCTDNQEHFFEHMPCDRFQSDATGPWFMISDALSGSKCGEKTGDFTLDNAKLRLEYLNKYMIQDREFNRHRMHLIMNKEGKNGAPHLARACINVEFDVIFD